MHNSTLKITGQPLLESLPVAILIVDEMGFVHYNNLEADKLLTPGFFESVNLIKLSTNFTHQNFLRVTEQLNHESSPIKFNITFEEDKIPHLFELTMVLHPEVDDCYLVTLNKIHLKNSLLKKNFKELKQFSRLNAMREISSSLADKLNQPLTAILSYTQAMQRLYQIGASFDEIDEAMERVVINAENAGNIIKNIRAQLKVNTLNCQKVCMNHLIQESLHLTELDSSTSPINFVTHYEPTFMTLCIDKTQMKQVIFSLINNAIDAVMEDAIKSPRISMTTRISKSCSDLQADLNYDSYYEIIISDNGPGLPEEVQDKLFEPFTTTKENGIGIGLSMCHHIIDLHKGSISIVSDNTLINDSLNTQSATIVTICLPLTSNGDRFVKPNS